jgi:hypothetical protein
MIRAPGKRYLRIGLSYWRMRLGPNIMQMIKA